MRRRRLLLLLPGVSRCLLAPAPRLRTQRIAKIHAAQPAVEDVIDDVSRNGAAAAAAPVEEMAADAFVVSAAPANGASANGASANGASAELAEAPAVERLATPAAARRRPMTVQKLKRALWTPLDVGHTHAVSGAAFLLSSVGWLVLAALAQGSGELAPAGHGPIWGAAASLVILAIGVWNGLSALPMAGDDRVRAADMDRYHALAFRWGGTAQLCACAWLCWWFSGLYPGVPWVLDDALCAAAIASIAWVIYFSEESIRKVNEKVAAGEGFIHGAPAAALSAGDHARLSALARLGSYPNLFQLPVLANVLVGGRPWLDRATDAFAHQPALLHHYLFACALSYAITFFATTLRDRKLISIEQDLAMLATGTAGPFLTMFLDVSAFPAECTLNPTLYNVGFL